MATGVTPARSGSGPRATWRVRLLATLLTLAALLVVAEAGREFKELATSDLGEPIYASPAFKSGLMVIRTAKTLFCVGERPVGANGGVQP